MTEFTVWSVVVAYLAAGAVYARGRIRHWSKYSDLWSGTLDDGERAAVAMGAIGAGLIWPLSIAFLAARDWLWKPADRDADRRDRMEADLRDWRERARTGSDDERRMAADIVTTLEDLLRES